MTLHVGWEPQVQAGRARGMAAVARARLVATLLFGPPAERDFAVRYWNGMEEPAGLGGKRFVVVVHGPGALRRIGTPPSELALGEAIVRGDIDIEGDLEAAVAVGNRIAARFQSPGKIARIVATASRLPREDTDDALEPRLPRLRHRAALHSPARDAAAVRAHYDVGNEFYALWLDKTLTYSCAYFERGDEDIDTAQALKIDYACRKLRLAPGDRFLDVGCGWGALVRHAARKYGVQALGITLSEQQARWAAARIREEGLTDRCRVVVADYRAIPLAQRFNKIASVGMIEHVGHARLGGYFARLFDVLEPGGILLNHGIVAAPLHRLDALRQRVLWRRGKFIDRHIFPDGELFPISDAVKSAESVGFEIRDVEMLREHYALTLRHWVRRLEAARERAQALVGQQTYRAWRLYMAASAEAFSSGRLNVAHILCARRSDSGRVPLPLTRSCLYSA